MLNFTTTTRVPTRIEIMYKRRLREAYVYDNGLTIVDTTGPTTRVTNYDVLGTVKYFQDTLLEGGWTYAKSNPEVIVMVSPAEVGIIQQTITFRKSNSADAGIAADLRSVGFGGAAAAAFKFEQ